MVLKEDFELIKELTEIQGCSGNEKTIREFIKSIVENHCDSIETDFLGNLICYIHGNAEKPEKKLRILLDAHMDEIGFIVRYIDKNGFIRFSPIGGQNIRILPGQKVTIHSYLGKNIIGVIGEKPIHLLSLEERKKVNQLDELFIDIGMSSAEEVNELITIGDYITLTQECVILNNTKRISAKSFDDRAGCFILIKLIQEFSKNHNKLDKDLIFLFSTQEEIGVRGATVGSYNVNPDIGIVVEVTHAIDFPGISKEKYYKCSLGSGASISVGPNIFSKLSKTLINIAKEKDIPYILEAEPRQAPNNARAIQLSRNGIPSSVISVPLRYMHTNIETLDYNDLINCKQLINEFLLKDLTDIMVN
ncbi:MAG: M42 family metallopeptidase [Candidatus Lokiarchaeota archaeon]|nr:M42 family metallopeptidase [Candidatus Lokiarchaeota archaeon]